MNLSPHFTLEEFCKTATGLSNEPEPEHMIALHVTAAGMETVRRIGGDRPIRITSGYRNRAVNREVGGVKNSDHALGYAVDFRHPHINALIFSRMIIESPLVFDQLILERNATLIHLSFNPRQRLQVLRQPGGPGSPFFPGLE